MVRVSHIMPALNLALLGLGRIWSFVLGFRSLVARLVKEGEQRERKNFWQWNVNSLRISAPQW